MPAYATADIWSAGTPFGNTHLGFPIGMDLRYYPTTDVFQNLVAGVITRLSGNPFAGVNMMFALSFPLTAVVAYYVLRSAGFRGPMAIAAAWGLMAIPYHWKRLPHVYLGSMYSAVLGVGLALWVGSGGLERMVKSRRRALKLAVLLGAIVLVAGSGIYYAAFTVILVMAAVAFRFARGLHWRRAVVDLLPAVAVAVATAAFLAPAALFVHGHPTSQPVAARLPVQSVAYSGVLAYAILPAPESMVPGWSPVNAWVERAVVAGQQIPTSGVIWDADFGSVFTVAALLVCLVGVVVVGRRGPRVRVEPRVSGALVTWLSAVVLLFFVPWGLNFLFAAAVSPQLRGWDRLVPVLFTLVTVGGGIAWRYLRWPSHGVWAAMIAVCVVVLVVFDTVLPQRAWFRESARSPIAVAAAGREYATALNSAIPQNCGVLELPRISYPEEPPVNGLDGYEHLWPALTNPGKSWSFGAMKWSSADDWQRSVPDPLDGPGVDMLVKAGFCAVHVDYRGFAPANVEMERQHFAALLGNPVATGFGGVWSAYRLRNSAS
ncbi:hypothetical protein [Cellulomonas sp. T2.31MG-18]|uniref:hypothetical protein n=1 Tax=Cellulomonas sp. T2.31MG-18 TaxID=3157619 RepID=UPI00366C48D4